MISFLYIYVEVIMRWRVQLCIPNTSDLWTKNCLDMTKYGQVAHVRSKKLMIS